MSSNNTENDIEDESEIEVITPEDVLNLAKKISNDSLVRLLDYSLDDYSKEKLGLTGSHKSLKVTFQRRDADSAETVRTFVKGLPEYNTKKDDDVFYMPVLMQESLFFEKVVPELIRDYRGEKWCPTYYLTMKKSIILEDLKLHDYGSLQGVYDNLAILKSVLTSLARFHSCSILAEARLSQQSKNPVMLNEYFSDCISEVMFHQSGVGAHWYKSGVNLACTLAERLGYDPEQIRNVFNRPYDIVKPSKIYQNVICHGDLHINNVMFADNAPSYKSVLIDFQTIRYAPLVTDILQLLHLNASKSFREQFEDELIQCYHSVLVETVKMHDPAVKVPTFESIVQGLEDLRVYGLILACVYIPLALWRSKENTKLVGDSKSLFEFLFGDRLEVVLAHMEVDKSYKDIVENAIIELAEKAAVI